MIEATVVAVTRTDAKRMWLLEVGADEVIVSQEEGGLFMGVLETVKSLVGVRLPVVVDKSRGCLLSMCAEACVWGFEVTVRSRVRGLGVFGSGSRMLWCGVNRRLRCWERATAMSPRRGTAFRVQGGREMKQVMRPAQRGATAPVGAGAWWRFPAGEPIGGHCARRGRGHGGRRDADRGTPSRWGLGWVAWILFSLRPRIGA